MTIVNSLPINSSPLIRTHGAIFQRASVQLKMKMKMKMKTVEQRYTERVVEGGSSLPVGTYL